MRLALIVNSFPTLSETFIFNKISGLLEAGLDVTVWIHSHDNDASFFTDRLGKIRRVRVQPTLLADGIVGLPWALARTLLLHPLHSLRLLKQAMTLYSNPRRSLRAWVMALPLTLGRFDLIHFEFSGLAVTYQDVLPLLRPAKLLTSCRGAAEQIAPLMHPERARQLEAIFAQLDAVHCVSADIQSTAQQYGLLPQKAFINYPSIDIQQFIRRRTYSVDSQLPYRILSVGRLHWKKGLEFGVLAMAQLIQAGLDVQYQIIGRGEEEEKLRYLIHTLGLTDKIILLGYQSAEKVRQALEEADIFLLPSLSEGLSNAVLEAMAMEIPVITTTAGGMAEAVTDGEEGFLVLPMQPDAMAEKIQTLLENPAMRVEMGQAGRKRVEHQFNLHRQIKCFFEQYDALVNGNTYAEIEQ